MHVHLIESGLQPAAASEACPMQSRDRNPALVYLAGLSSEQSRRTMHQALDTMAEGLTDNQADWLALRGGADGPLFCAIRKGGHLVRRQRLTEQAVYHILAARAGQAGVAKLSPHDFRRTFVGDLLDAGVDISTVQRMAGHANVSATAKYDRRPEETKRKAAELLHVPYRRRRFYEG